MADWLELELAHQLAPAKAPDELWERVQRGRLRQPERKPVWPIAAIVTMMIAAGAMWMAAKGEQPSLDLERLAKLQLESVQPLDLASHDEGEIRAWAKRSADLEVRIASSPGVQVVGARVLRERGERMVAVSYQVDGRPAALIVARAALKGNTPHAGMAMAGADGSCLICHSL